eukprot:8161972-Pyramimonas_sp.AAC.1
MSRGGRRRECRCVEAVAHERRGCYSGVVVCIDEELPVPLVGSVHGSAPHGRGMINWLKAGVVGGCVGEFVPRVVFVSIGMPKLDSVLRDVVKDAGSLDEVEVVVGEGLASGEIEGPQ